MREALLAFKFKGRKDVGRLLIRLLEDELKAMREEFDVIVPLPVTEKRLKERGFNQSYVMAEEIGVITGRPAQSPLSLQTEERQRISIRSPGRKEGKTSEVHSPSARPKQ